MVLSVIEMIPITCLAIILLIAAIMDIRAHKIPNWLTFPTIVFGIVYHTSISGCQGLVFSMMGMTLGLALLMVFYLMGGTGAGDVKLLGAVGGLLGPNGVFAAFVCSALIGGIYAIILLVLHVGIIDSIKRYGLMLKTFISTMTMSYIPPENKGKRPVLCYGVVIALGTLVSILRDVIYRI